MLFGVLCCVWCNDVFCGWLLQIKCYQYWPCGVVQDHVDVMEFGNFRISYLSERMGNYFTIRSLELENLTVST